MKNKFKAQKMVKQNKSSKNMKGITLIALVITIVILIILAGVSIDLVLGENGLFEKAKNANEKMSKAHYEELKNLTIAEAAMNFEQTWFTYTDNGEEKKIPIPAYFAVSQVEGENNVENGLVIIDNKGNEFVWIPCDDFSKYKEAKNLIDEWKNDDTVTAGNITINYTLKEWSEKDSSVEEEYEKSIEKYKGFYVARYEAGVPSSANFYVASNEGSNGVEYKGIKFNITNEKYDISVSENLRNVSDFIPVSKKENQVWNFISQENAKKVSEAMYKDNSTVDSYLINSNAWNYICKYIFEKYKGKSEILHSAEWGNYYETALENYKDGKGLYTNWPEVINNVVYSYGDIYTLRKSMDNKTFHRLELATGTIENFKVYNIYDMAGNVYEWTAETAETVDEKGEKVNWCAARGASFQDAGNDRPVVNWTGYATDYDFSNFKGGAKNIGFRPVLYVK